jgi:hypothetical protein
MSHVPYRNGWIVGVEGRGRRGRGGGSGQGGLPEEYCTDLKGWAPFIFQDVQADSAQLVDIGVVDLRQKANLHSRFKISNPS